MRIWIDTEFNEHEHRNELISMALVTEDGREWYQVVRPDSPIGPWVKENVMPKLGKEPIGHSLFALSLAEFLQPYRCIHVITDWPTDAALFCDALITGPGQRIDTPPLTLEVTRIDSVSMDPHNALQDARAFRLAYLVQHGELAGALPRLLAQKDLWLRCPHCGSGGNCAHRDSE